LRVQLHTFHSTAERQNIRCAMRAVLMERAGPAKEALAYVTDFAKPVRQPDEVLVQTACTSINPVSACQRACPARTLCCHTEHVR
jgi:hypothetical protein